MSIELITVLMVGSLLLLLLIGVPLAFALGFVAVAFAYAFFGWNALQLIASRIYGFVNVYVLLSVPMFLLMAAIMDRSGVARDLYDAMSVWAGGLPGGVGVMTLIAAVFMAATTGIIGGEIILLGLVALPQMLRLGYDQNLAIGTICAGGSLGTMIPPSIVLIVYGLITETSIHALFIAAVIPGLMLGGIYIVYVIVRTQLNPSLAPIDESIAADMSLKERLTHAKGIIPPVLLVFVVLGSIYGGVTSITEAAGIGVVGSLAIIAFRGELNWRMFNEALAQTFRSAGTILWVTFGATILAGAYNLSGGPSYVANSILGLDLPPFGVILAMMAIFLLLGMFMDWIGIVLLAMPVFLPIVTKLGYDPIWFGILFCINMQVSFLSPPFGPAAFYLKSVAPPEIDLIDIFRSFGPFICLQLVVLALVLLFPWLATALL
jgi:tripartite ATP-independent transporter DctM subunit